jgi:hypothetical protein
MVIRIMVMVPIYAIASFISLFSLEAAFFIDAVRDIYEVTLLLCLIVQIFGTDACIGFRHLLLLCAFDLISRWRAFASHFTPWSPTQGITVPTEYLQIGVGC